MRRTLFAAMILAVLALLPMSASASRARLQQTFTFSADVAGISGVCPEFDPGAGSNPQFVAAGAVNDVLTEEQPGVITLKLGQGAPFPQQVEGFFYVSDDHILVEIDFTGVYHCLDAQTLQFTGLVWSGEMLDRDVDQAYVVTGAGRYNSFEFTNGPGGFAITFSGTARPTHNLFT